MLALVILFSAACKKDNTQNGTATMKVHLTDAPGLYDAVYVDIQRVEVHVDGQGWAALNTYSGIYNLLDYSNGVDTLLATDQLPAGLVTQIRLILGTNNSVEIAGVNFPLATPSAQQSGLKLNINQQLSAGATYGLLLDFDAGRSIVQTGALTYILKPVISASVMGVNTGIQGSVTPSVNAYVMAYNTTDTAGSFTNAQGEFLINIKPGTYDVWAQPAAPYNDTTINGVVVIAGSFTSMGVIDIQ